MKTIYRYELSESFPRTVLDLPSDSKVLSVGISEDVPCIWVEHDSEAPKKSMVFWTFGTGADLSETENFSLKYLGTYQKKNQYAFHVYAESSLLSPGGI